MLYVVCFQDAIDQKIVKSVVLFQVRCGKTKFEPQAFILESTDIVNKAFHVCIKPLLVGFEGEKMVRIWIRNYGLWFRADVNFCTLLTCFHHLKMLSQLPTLHR